MRVSGERIKKFREEKGISAAELAAAADYRTPRRINQIEAGEVADINRNIALAIARKLGRKLEEIAL